jgi:hypothetical protein
MVIFADAEISGSRPAKTKATVLVAKAPTANHIRRLSMCLFLCSIFFEQLNLMRKYVKEALLAS